MITFHLFKFPLIFMPFPSFSVFLWIYGVTDLWIPDYVALKASPQNCKLHFTNIVLQFRPRVRRNMYEEKDIDHALNAVASEDMSAAEQACVYLEGAVRDGRHFEIIDRIRNASGATKTNSVIYMRFMRLLSSMLSFGEEEFKHCAEVGALTDVIELCTTNDVLVQMNAIELLLCLTSTYRGLEYMCAHGTLTWLVNISCGLDGEPDPLISTQALRVLGDVFSRAAVKRFDLRSRMSTDVVAHFLERILRHFEEGAEDERLAGTVVNSLLLAHVSALNVSAMYLRTALGALADFALISTSTLEIVVTGSARLLTAWMDLLVNTKPEMVAAVLNSVALILSQSDEAYVRNSVTNEAGVTVFVAASGAEPAFEPRNTIRSAKYAN